MTVDEHQNSTLTLRDLRRFGHDTTSCQGMLMARGVHRHIFNYVLRPLAALALGDPSMILGWKRWVLGAGSPEERLASTP